MLLFISCYRYSSLVRAWRMCANKWGTVTFSHFIFHTLFRCFACCSKATGAIPAVEGKQGRGQGGGGHGGTQAAEAQIRPSYSAALTSSTRLAQGWITGQQAGLHAAVALVTHSNEAWASTGTSSIFLLSFHSHSDFLPSLFPRIFFIFHFLFSFAPFLKKEKLTTGMRLMSWLPWRQKLCSNKAVELGWGQRKR